MNEIKRESQLITVLIDISEDDDLSEEIDFREWAFALLEMPAAITACSIGFKIAHTSGGTFLPLYDHDGNLVQISSPSVDCAYELPPEVAAARYVKLWSQDGSGSNTAQAADRSFTLHRKT